MYSRGPFGRKGGAATVAFITDAAGLIAALNAATGGETIYISGANFANMTLSGYNFASKVTIRSFNVQAAMFDNLTISGCNNLVLRNVTITRSAGAYDFITVLDINSCTNIDIIHCEFFGLVTSFYWFRVDVTNSSYVLFEDNYFHTLSRCIVFDTCQHVTVRGNHTRRIGEGFNFASCSDFDIEDNDSTEFTGAPGAHIDVYQGFADDRTVGNIDLRFRRNIMWPGANTEVQSFFFASTTTLGAQQEWQPNTAYALNAVVYVTPGSNRYICTTAGTSGNTKKGYQFSGQPEPGSFLIFVEVRYIKFVTGTPGAWEVQIGATLDDTLTNLYNYLSGSGDAYLSRYAYTLDLANDRIYVEYTGAFTGTPVINLCASSDPDANAGPVPPMQGTGTGIADGTCVWDYQDSCYNAVSSGLLFEKNFVIGNLSHGISAGGNYAGMEVLNNSVLRVLNPFTNPAININPGVGSFVGDHIIDGNLAYSTFAPPTEWFAFEPGNLQVVTSGGGPGDEANLFQEAVGDYTAPLSNWLAVPGSLADHTLGEGNYFGANDTLANYLLNQVNENDWRAA